ncbi:hypothetical protein E2C01_077886 [Portunus trituberculatus]|uniref:Uncharacterized protein n=1 Tax=Portunus trituberculatus TaxID=210409 RepID=A0A5B7INF5_PORTR|nr:hypothetical protein [Portunus trituberculatus]
MKVLSKGYNHAILPSWTWNLETEHLMELEAALGAKEKWNSSSLHKMKLLPIPEEYGPHNPRQSKRQPKPSKMLNL